MARDNLTPVPTNPSFPYHLNNRSNCDTVTSNQINPNNQTIKIYSGSSVNLNIKFPFSLNGITFAVVQSKPENLMDEIIIEPVDEYNVKLILNKELTSNLPLYGKSMIRIGVTFPDGTQRNYNNIFIEVE